MAVLLDIDRRICYLLTKLAMLGVLCFTLCAATPTHGFNPLDVRGLTRQKYNNTIEIAVFVPEYGLSRNDCCPPNEITCGREGTECQCQQEGLDCMCVCPTDNFPIGFHFDKDDCCPPNNTYCKRHGDDCECEQNDSGCQCVCPELDYTVRLAAGIAIVLLIGVTVMLVISLYRRAALSRRQRRSEGGSISSDISSCSNPEPPPRYADVYLISTPKVADADSIDFEKLPSYEEALSLQACNGSDALHAQAHTSMDTKIMEGLNSAVICMEQGNQIGHTLESLEDEVTTL